MNTMHREDMIYSLLEKNLEDEKYKIFIYNGFYSYNPIGEDQMDSHSIIIGEFGDEEVNYDLIDYILPY